MGRPYPSLAWPAVCSCGPWLPSRPQSSLTGTFESPVCSKIHFMTFTHPFVVTEGNSQQADFCVDTTQPAGTQQSRGGSGMLAGALHAEKALGALTRCMS